MSSSTQPMDVDNSKKAKKPRFQVKKVNVVIIYCTSLNISSVERSSIVELGLVLYNSHDKLLTK